MGKQARISRQKLIDAGVDLSKPKPKLPKQVSVIFRCFDGELKTIVRNPSPETMKALAEEGLTEPREDTDYIMLFDEDVSIKEIKDKVSSVLASSLTPFYTPSNPVPIHYCPNC